MVSNGARSSMKVPSADAIRVKLMVNGRTNRVIFAEAGRDLVDPLFGLLTMRFSSAVRSLDGNGAVGSSGSGATTMPGSLFCLYASAASLNPKYIEEPPKPPASLTRTINNPATATPAPIGGALDCSPRVLQEAETLEAERERRALQAALETRVVYYCDDCRFGNGMSEASLYPGHLCKNCNHPLYSKLTLLEEKPCLYSGYGVPATAAGRYVRDVRYMVTDDLAVVPSSASSLMELLQRSGVDSLADLEEKAVDVGEQERVALLRASLVSTTALTDVFLGSNADATVEAEMGEKEASGDGVVDGKRKLSRSCRRLPT